MVEYECIRIPLNVYGGKVVYLDMPLKFKYEKEVEAFRFEMMERQNILEEEREGHLTTIKYAAKVIQKISKQGSEPYEISLEILKNIEQIKVIRVGNLLIYIEE